MKHQVGDLLANVNRGIIVHGCNAQGVMGGGFALQVKNRYPAAYEKYKQFVSVKGIRDTKNYLGICVPVQVTPNLIIVNAITQNHYGTDKRYVDYEAVAQCFESLNTWFPEMDIHYPMIGAGLAGGNWNIIRTIINETLVGREHFLWVKK